MYTNWMPYTTQALYIYSPTCINHAYVVYYNKLTFTDNISWSLVLHSLHACIIMEVV